MLKNKLSPKAKRILLILTVFILCFIYLNFFSGTSSQKTPDISNSSSGTFRETAESYYSGILSEIHSGTSSYSNSVSSEFNYYEVPAFENSPYYVVNNNVPYFTDEENKNSFSFEMYSEFDTLNRCGTAYANLSKELMPNEKREEISSVHPTGWYYNNKSNNNKYNFVDNKYIYNRCHLIGFQLAGENANEKNLITGTRYLNVDGMLPFENMVADYIKETDNHVLYRVTPVFIKNESVCRGVLMEAYSVEDNGLGIEFCVFCYNVQPGVSINYQTGENAVV